MERFYVHETVHHFYYLEKRTALRGLREASEEFHCAKIIVNIIIFKNYYRKNKIAINPTQLFFDCLTFRPLCSHSLT